MSEAVLLSYPERTSLVRRAASRLCLRLGWAPVHEVPLPNGRRADIMALRPDGVFICIEVKSGRRDFDADTKWPEYREFSDQLYFAVDEEFPLAVLPDEVGVIVTCPPDAELIREAPAHPMPPARRRALLTRHAWLAASRLSMIEDPAGMAMARSALSAE